MVHVRDTLTEPADRPARDLMRPVLNLDASTPVYAALAAMRETRNHLAVVSDAGAFAGVVTLSDVLGRLFPRPAGPPVSAQDHRTTPEQVDSRTCEEGAKGQDQRRGGSGR